MNTVIKKILILAFFVNIALIAIFSISTEAQDNPLASCSEYNGACCDRTDQSLFANSPDIYLSSDEYLQDLYQPVLVCGDGLVCSDPYSSFNGSCLDPENIQDDEDAIEFAKDQGTTFGSLQTYLRNNGYDETRVTSSEFNSRFDGILQEMQDLSDGRLDTAEAREAREQQSLDVASITTVPGEGSSCQLNFAECPSGYTNIVEGINSANLYGDLDSQEFILSIQRSFGENSLNRTCIQQDLTEFVQIVGNDRSTSGGEQLQLTGYAGNVDGNAFIPKACPSGWEAQRAPWKNGPNRADVWGCCPSDFVFVNQPNQSSDSAFQAGVCCAVRGGKVPNAWIAEGSGQKGCGIVPNQADVDDPEIVFEFSHNLDAGESTQSSPSSGFRSLQDLEDKLAAGEVDYIVDVWNSEVFGATNPQLGLGLGEFFMKDATSTTAGTLDSRVVLAESQGSTTSCPLFSKCSVISESNEFEKQVIEDIIAQGRQDELKLTQLSSSDDSAQGRVFSIDAAALEEIDGLGCRNCYAEGEALAIQGRDVFICGEDGSANTEAIPDGLSVQDYLTVRLARQVSGEENANAQTQCLANGGLWVAVGCIDPTPTGIITGLIRIAFGVMGGVALVQLIYAGIVYQGGNEEKIAEARNRVIATLAGIALLVFSILILRVIGINILDVLPEGSV